MSAKKKTRIEPVAVYEAGAKVDPVPLIVSNGAAALKSAARCRVCGNLASGAVCAVDGNKVAP